MKSMKYMMILVMSLSSHFALGSYHGGGDAADGGSYDDDGYSSGANAAYALVGVGVLYYVFRNKDDNNEAEFSNNFLSPESNNQLVIDFEKSTPFSGQDNFSYDPLLEKDFQVNLKFKFN
jgi:hypothetical protein